MSFLNRALRNTNGAKRSGRLHEELSSGSNSNIFKIVVDDRKVKLHDIAKILKARVSYIFARTFGHEKTLVETGTAFTL
jgi:hypothetical protein